MVASLGASEAFTAHFLDDPENWAKIEEAQIYCSEVKQNNFKINQFNFLGFFSCFMS